MSGVAVLSGWRKQVAHMFTSERLPMTAAYTGSTAMTLYAALVLNSYLLSLLFSGVQVKAGGRDSENNT